MFTKQDREHVEGLGTDINSLFDHVDRLDKRISELYDRHTKLTQSVSVINNVVNHNAESSAALEQQVKDINEDMDLQSEAIDLLASATGKVICTKPAVPATITFTPGEPERLVLKKAPKKEYILAPEPITLEVPTSLLEPNVSVLPFQIGD